MKTFLPELLRCAVAVLLIGAATLACYENSVGGAFVFDDDHFIVENDNIKHFRMEKPELLKKDIESIVAYNPFRVLLSVTFALNFKYAERKSYDDFSPYGFHVVNIVVHFLASVLVFFVVRKIILIYRRDQKKGGGPAARCFPALIAGLLFASCPLHTEAVTYIVQRGESMCAMFILAAILCFLHARSRQMSRYDAPAGEKPKRRSYAWLLAGIPLLVVIYKAAVILAPPAAGGPPIALIVAGVPAALYLAAIVLGIILGIVIFPHRIQWGGDVLLAAAYFFFGLAALTKELAAVLPLLLLLTEAAVFRAGRSGHLRRALRYHAPFLVTLALFFVLRLLVVLPAGQTAGGWEGTRINAAYLEQQTSGSVVLKYLGKIFVPLELNLDPDVGLFDAGRGDRLLSAEFAGLFLVLLGAILLQKSAPLPAFGVMWFFAALLPTSSVLEFADVMAEHRAYLASMGIFMAAGVALTEAARLRKSRAARLAAAAAALVFLAVILVSNTARVRERNRQYWNPITLWADTARKSPDKARTYNALGYLFMKEGSPERISEQVRAANEKLASMKGLPDTDPAVARQAEIVMNGLEEALRDQTRSLVAARTFLVTADIYDMKDLWEIIKGKRGMAAAPERFAHLQANRVYNNLGVVYSQKAEGLRTEMRYAAELKRDAAKLEQELTRNRLKALACYGISTCLNPFGVQALLNSSKIRSAMAIDFESRAKAAPESEREKYWGCVEEEMAAAESLVIRAMAINRFYRGSVEHMRNLELAMAAYYDPLYLDAGEKNRKDPGKALEHWRRLEWLSGIDPLVDRAGVNRAIIRLEPAPSSG